MAENSSIEWTDASWNPVRGCTRVSEGCRRCYAEGIAARFSGEGQPYEGLAKMTPSGPRWTGEIMLVEDALKLPMRWKKPRRIFVNSMSDLFHEKVPFEFIDKVFAVMALARRHTFQVLTKRPERMREYFADNSVRGRIADEALKHRLWMDLAENIRNSPYCWPLPNVWLGVSVENQQAADERIPELLKVPARVRFLSCEPLLSRIEFSNVTRRADCVAMLGKPALSGIHWVIVGGESGPSARPCDLAWIRSLARQCRAVEVPCFVKQLGKEVVVNGRDARRIDDREENRARLFQGASDGDVWHWNPRDKKGGDIEEWPEDLQVREFPHAEVAA